MSWADVFPGFRLRLTRWGFGYLVACVVLGMAAVNTGNNALMALLGLVLGSYVISGYWSRQVLAAIAAEVEVPAEIYAGRTTVVDIRLLNTSRVFPAYGLVIRDGQGKAVIVEALLNAGASSRHSIEVVMEERGWHELGPWRVDVLLPLGFFLKSKTLASDKRVLVFPRLLPSAAVAVRRGGGRRAPDAMESRGREGEVTQLRNFREGDDVRAVHWKQTARQQRLVVVERQRAAEKPVYFVLDPRLEDPGDPIQQERLERLISEVATGIVQRLREGVMVGLVVGPTVVKPVRAARRAPVLLRPLAEVEAMPMSADEPIDVGAGRKAQFSLRRGGPR